MKRDFSDEAKERLLSLVKQVNDEKWCDFTDWFGDRWGDLQYSIGFLKLEDDLGNVDAFHKSIIDKNNLSADKINEIFSNVNDIDSGYGVRFAALLTQVQRIGSLIERANAVIQPSTCTFDSGQMTALKNEMAAYSAERDLLTKIAGDGITSEELETTDPVIRNNILSSLISNLVDYLPNLGLGEEFTLMLGPGLMLYYAVEGSIDNNSPYSIDTEIANQRVGFKNFTTTADSGVGLTGSGNIDKDGNSGLSIKSESTSATISENGLEGSASFKIGESTYTVKVGATMSKELTFEESIETPVQESGSITSTIGIKKQGDEGNWPKLPQVESEPTLVNHYAPSLDGDAVKTTVIVVGGIILWGAAAYFSGGASLTVAPVPIF